MLEIVREEKKLRRILVAGVVVIILLTGLNIVYASMQSIGEPIMMDHFVEVYVNEEMNGMVKELLYITDSSDKRRINAIRFDEVHYGMFYVNQTRGGGFTFWNNGVPQYNDSYSRYHILKRGYMQINLSKEDYEKIRRDGKMVLEEAVVEYDDGTEQAVNVGQIILKPHQPRAEDEKDIGNVSSHSRGYYTSFIYKGELARINDIGYDFKDVMAPYNGYYYSVDYGSEERLDEAFDEFENLEYVSFEDAAISDNFQFSHYFAVRTNNVDGYQAVVETLLHVELEDEEGNTGTRRIFHTYTPHMGGKEIEAYVDYVEALEEE